MSNIIWDANNIEKMMNGSSFIKKSTISNFHPLSCFEIVLLNFCDLHYVAHIFGIPRF